MRVCVVILLALSDVALAQTPCPRGQSVTAETAGHCCWMAQHWSEQASSCVGYPLCPADMRADGETCVPLSAPAPVAVPPPMPATDPYENPAAIKSPPQKPAVIPTIDPYENSAADKSPPPPPERTLAPPTAPPPALVTPPPAPRATRSRPGLGRAGWIAGSLLLALGLVDASLGVYLAASVDGAYHETAGGVCLTTGLIGAIAGVVVLALSPSRTVVVEAGAIRWRF
jgi:hypothetical protein